MSDTFRPRLFVLPQSERHDSYHERASRAIILEPQPRAREQIVDVWRRRGLQNQPAACERVREGDTPRVQGLTRKRAQRGGERRVRDLGPSRLAVLRIADDRPATRGQVDADLMAAPRAE